MATPPVVDLQRFARAIRARVAGANIVGATLVFLYFGLFPSTGVTGGARGMHTTIVSLVTFGAYMTFTGLVAFNYGPRSGRAALSWLSLPQSEIDRAERLRGGAEPTRRAAEVRVDRSHARFLSACRTLATVRKLLARPPTPLEFAMADVAETAPRVVNRISERLAATAN